MRRTLVLCLAVVSAPALVASCIGAGEIVLVESSDASATSDTGGGGTGGSDGSSMTDGATTGDGTGGDGQSGDGGLDGAAEAGPGIVTAKVTTAAGPEPGVTIFFSGADGSLLTTGETNGQGQATATVPPGAMVTAILGSAASQFNLITYVGVEPGDVLPFVDTTAPTTTPPSFDWKLTAVPTSVVPDDDGGTSTFDQVYGPCSSAGFGATSLPQIFTSCTWSGPLPVLLIAGKLVQGQAQSLDGFVYSKTAMNPSDGGTLSVNLDEAWIATTSVAVNASNVDPDNAPFIYQNDYSDGFVLNAPTLAGTTDADAGTESVTFQGFPGFPDFVQTETQLTNDSPNSILAIRNDTVPASVSFDVSQALPYILAGGFDTVTHPARPTVTWTPVGSLASADGTFVSFQIENVNWTLLVPPAATTVTVPELPPLDGGPAFVAGGYLYNDIIATVDSDGVSGYAALRQLGTTLMPVPNYGALAPPLPAAGQLYRATLLTP